MSISTSPRAPRERADPPRRLRAAGAIAFATAAVWWTMHRPHSPARPAPRSPRDGEGEGEGERLLALLPEPALLAQDGVVTFANDAALATLGLPREGLLGRPVASLPALRAEGAGAGPAPADPALDGGRAGLAVIARDVRLDDRDGKLYLLRPAGAPGDRRRGEREALGVLSRRLLEAQEGERRRVARELYDEIGQSLSAVRLQFAQLRRKSSDPALLAPLESAERMTDRALDRIRDLALLLHPPQLETLGLEAAIRWHLQARAAMSGLPIAFDVAPGSGEAPPQVAIVAFRIVEEAVANALRHADARRIDVRMRQESGELALDVIDDGRGFLVDASSDAAVDERSGMLAMRERARALGGECRVHSAPGAGTRIALTLPCP
jgi:signal transduction histidine kinase